MSKSLDTELDKLNKQIDSLSRQNKRGKYDTDDISIINRRRLNKELNNVRDKVIINDKKYHKAKNNKPVRDNIVVAPSSKKKVKEKEQTKKDIEQTKKFKMFENNMKSLYDKVDDVYNDVTYTKTVKIPKVVDNTLVSHDKLDDVDVASLDRLVATLGKIFCILLAIILIFVIFISIF